MELDGETVQEGFFRLLSIGSIFFTSPSTILGPSHDRRRKRWDKGTALLLQTTIIRAFFFMPIMFLPQASRALPMLTRNRASCGPRSRLQASNKCQDTWHNE